MPRRKSKAEPSSLPDQIYAEVSVKSIGGVSLFDFDEPITPHNVKQFWSKDKDLVQAMRQLKDEGFEVLSEPREGEATLSVRSSPECYEKACKGTFKLVEVRYPVGRRRHQDVTHIHFTGQSRKYERFLGLVDGQDTVLREVIEGIDIVAPAQVFQVSPHPPQPNYHHLSVPDGVKRALRADEVQQQLGLTGKDIHVVMIDTGYDATHPYFDAYNRHEDPAVAEPGVNPVIAMPGAEPPGMDESGHGTGISANLLAVASDVTFTPIKLKRVGTRVEKKRRLEFAIGLEWGLKRALQVAPDVITCSLGLHAKKLPVVNPNAPHVKKLVALEAEIMHAWLGRDNAKGIVMIFAAGNNGVHGFPAQSNFVIAAGGVYIDKRGTLRASNYASGYASNIYEDRKVPDVCGLCGTQDTYGQYIMMPVPPGSKKDEDYGSAPLKAYPASDETAPDDGWACFSGTSAAAPQLAGVAALMLQAFPEMPPNHVRHIMQMTARDVKTGKSANGNEASAGPDLATGSGLVDAYWAVRMTQHYRQLHAATHAHMGPHSFPAPKDDPNLILLADLFNDLRQ